MHGQQNVNIYMYIYIIINTQLATCFGSCEPSSGQFLIHSHGACIEDAHYGIPYLLTPWCRVLFEKLTGFKLVKKFPSYHGTRSFITALTSVRHLSLSWASPG